MSISKTDDTSDSFAEEYDYSPDQVSNSSQKITAFTRNTSKSIQNLGTRLKTIFAKKQSGYEASYQEMINDHLSNTLGVIKLLSTHSLNAEQVENIASLKSSCDFLFEKLGIPYPAEFNHALDTPIIKKQRSIDSKSILLVCSHPLQKKILKNLIANWGYQIQILSSLPEDLSILGNMNYDLILIAHGEHNISEQQIKTFVAQDIDFLVMTNGISSMRARNKEFPVIEGPIDPDFLSYKMKKIIKSRALKEKGNRSSH